METTCVFPKESRGGFVAIQGRVYHRLRPDHKGTGLRWVLYDGYNNNLMPHRDYNLPEAWINALKTSLIRDNPFVRQLINLHELSLNSIPNHVIELNGGGVDEIAAILRYNNTAVGSVDARNLIVAVGSDAKVQIPTVSRLWEPLAYPLFFDKGTLGWGVVGDQRVLPVSDSGSGDESAIHTTQMWYYRIMLLTEERFQIFGRLTNEYLVDMWTRELETRLYYIRMNHERRLEQDAELMGTTVSELLPRENIYLPTSFIGSIAWASDNVSDALALASAYGSPTFFITVTCNPDWPEIQNNLRSGQHYQDQPVLVSRVFKQKLKNIMDAICKMFPNAGKVLYKMHVIEFQKRGLPHAHILIRFERECSLATEIDSVISAEMPSEESDAALIRKFMMHKHNTKDGDIIKLACQVPTSSGRSRCRFSYPHRLQEVTTIDYEGRVHYRRRKSGDEWVVPHCLALIRMFLCHINFEAANTSHIFAYLFKYIHKGADRARFSIRFESDEVFDEINMFWSGRYLSAGEAAWRVLGYHVTRKDPSVTSLPVHLSSSKRHVQFYRRKGNSSTLSLLDRYFRRPMGLFRDRSNVIRRFIDLKYEEYYTIFRLIPYDNALVGKDDYYEEQVLGSERHGIRQMCVLRQATKPHICRLESVQPSKGEPFYLRSILSVRPGTTYDDLLDFNGTVYRTYQEAAHAMGLFADTLECVRAFEEAVLSFKTPTQLRFFFVHMLVNDCIETPVQFWDKFKGHLSYDYFLRSHGNQVVAHTRCKEDLNRYLAEYDRNLEDFGIPFFLPSENEIYRELSKWSPFLDDLRQEACSAVLSMTTEQLKLYEDVISAVDKGQSLPIFVDGKAGTGKTHVIRMICNFLRSKEKIVMATATSAFAAQLYDGGRTAHSAFKVPVNSLNELLESDIKPNSHRAMLIRAASLIIWDEAPMANKAVLECVDIALRNIMSNDIPFGGKVIILSGDFRQTCPIVRHGEREDIIEASIHSSYLWPKLKIYRLTIPIRQALDVELSKYLDSIGDGEETEVPISYLNTCHSAPDLIDFVFPQNVLDNPILCVSRSILCPTNRQVDNYNKSILSKVEGIGRRYLSADTIKEADDLDVVPPTGYLDYHRTHTPPGLPAHDLYIKVNGVYRLMRNLSVDRGLVKNCRVIVKGVGHSVISVQIVTKHGPMNEDILLPRIIFTYCIPNSGFTLYRRQFPLMAAYATTFNSCQGLTLDKVGVDLTNPVFSHGQLYTALSRIRRREDGILRIYPEMDTMHNITFKELLRH